MVPSKKGVLGLYFWQSDVDPVDVVDVEVEPKIPLTEASTVLV